MKKALVDEDHGVATSMLDFAEEISLRMKSFQTPFNYLYEETHKVTGPANASMVELLEKVAVAR